MKKILLLIIIHFYFVSKGQEKYTYDFEKLGVTDTIYDNETIKSLKNDSQFIYADYFFVSRHFDGEIDGDINCLIKAKKDYWISYSLPFDYDYRPGNSTSLIGPSENKNYFFASSYNNHLSHGGGHGNENTIKNLMIVNIQETSYIQIVSYTEDMFWDTAENGEQSSNKSIMSSNYILENNHLTILNTCFDDDEISNCPNSGGLYEIKNNRVRKIKNYEPLKKGFTTTINYAGDIAIGMTLEEIQLAYPNALFSKTDNPLATCANSKTAIKVWDDKQLLGYALTKQITENTNVNPDSDDYIDKSNEKTYQFIVVSPMINFEKINTNTTAEEVIKLYPKANVRLDSLTEWEHIYIEELNIELVFKTDEKNRIGIYKNERFVKLKNKKTKLDFIVVSD